MEVILKSDIQDLGFKEDLVSVKDGYGRNYLIPQGMAVLATDAARKVREENIRQAAHKAEKIKRDAEATAEKIGDMVLEIKAKAGESGKIFGAVTPLQVADALSDKGIEVDRKKIKFKDPIKELGTYTLELQLHKEVSKELTIDVVAA